MFSANGQSVWIGAENSDWTNPANWSAGVPTAGSVATIPANPVSPVFGGTPIIDYTIQLAGMLTFNDFVYNTGNIIIFESGSIVNNAQFINANGRILDVDGHFENNGTLDNFGMIDVAASGSLDNEVGGVFNNNKETLAFGPVLNAGTTNNNGSFNVIVSLDNSGTFNNYGTFESQAESTTENRSGAKIENFEGGSYSTNGIYNNLGETSNAGNFIVQIASIFTNEGLLVNGTTGDMEVAGSIINNSTFTVNGPLMINSIGIVENNTQIDNNGGINIEICGNLIQQNTGNIDGSIQNNGNVYEINGTINETNLEFGETFTDLTGRPAPVPACKKDAFLQLPESGTITFTAADIEKGRSYGSCGAQIVSTTVTPTSFMVEDIGVQIVTITVTDEFGNSASCNDFVTVLPFTPPIVPIDDADIDFDCPEDVMVVTEAGAQFAPATFTIPDATTNCSPEVPTPPVSVTICPEIDNAISGFTFLGQRGGSKYFVSHAAENWTDANAIAQANGGELVTIDDADENLFIKNAISPASGSVWTGLRKFNNSDDFTWESEADANYFNWSYGEPNGTTDHIGVRLVKSHGQWTDRPMGTFHYEFVIEVSCYDVAIAGYDCLGSYDGSLYYQSQATENWTVAANAATALGGNLATINSAAENTFIKNAIHPSTGSVWIGLRNNNNGNNFSWQSGAPVNYTNWNAGEPNETHLDVAVRLVKSHGLWTDRVASNNYFEYVVEIPAPTMTPTCAPTGNIQREVWTNVDGHVASDIPVNTTPNLIEDLTAFEAPTDSGDNYGSRIRGYIYPPTTGAYRFWIASDDEGELWLSTNENPANKARIANVPGWTVSREWNKFPEQRSALINLQAGQRYYIEALHKEGVGGDNLAVRWALPDGTIQTPIPGSVLSGVEDCNNTNPENGDPALTVTQIAGPQSGGNFPIGETPILVEIKDACGNLEICEFNIVVEENPAVFELTDCPDNITVNTLPGASTAVATFGAPSGNSTCFRGGPVSVVQNVGLESGEAFPIGNTQITYAVFDSCGNFEGCNFIVNVVETAAEISTTCPEDVVLQVTNNSTVTANWTEPTASTDCFVNGLTISQVAGPANGSDLAVGTYAVIYVFTDACNNTEICTFNIIVNGCTDVDGDGTCAAEDCDDTDANLPAAPGTACDDGDAETENDVIGADGCSCTGTVIVACANEGGDADGDGICANVDCDDTDANLPAAPGTACNDGDAETENDVIGADGCSCAGTPISTDPDCADIIITPGVDNITISGLNAPINAIQVFNSSWVQVFKCFADCDGPQRIVDGLVEGTYYVKVAFYTSSYQLICEVTDYYVVSGGDACGANGGDADGDGICADVDCNDNDASLPAAPGTACNDGNAATENDVIGADGCSCAGTVIVEGCAASGGDADGDGICADVDCNDNDASLPAAPGTVCNDGNAATENDVIGADGCSCAGTVIVEGCAASGGDADGDGICADEDCNDNDASLPAAPGTACNDGKSETTNDIIGADGCSCAGTPIETGCNPTYVLSPGNITVNGLNGAINSVKILDIGNGWQDVVNCFGNCPAPASFDLPAGPYYLNISVRDANYNVVCELVETITITDGCTTGATCNDNDICTTDDAFDANCNCIGTPVADNDNDGFCAVEDCDDNDASLPATPGSTCDDGNPDTTGDVYSADGCTCAGVIVGACNPTATPLDNTLMISGLSGPYNTLQVFNTSNWSTVANCWGDCYDQVINVVPGTYFVRLKVLDDGYQVVCEMEGNVTVGGSETFSIAPDTEFLHLFAREEDRTVGLNWVNNSEYRNDYFVVERSVDGINFTELKTVDAYGYESQEVTNYEDEDIRPTLGEGFYRVRQVFEDGTMRYSNVEKVSFDIDLTAIGLFPNPAEAEVQLSLIDFAGRSAEIQIYSPLGVLMDAVSLEEIPARAIRFNVASYQAGLYTITVKVDQRKRFSKRFVKIVN